MKLYYINSDYIDVLHDADNRVMLNKEQSDGSRPYVGVIIPVAGIDYYAPLSSPKSKHLKMKNIQDIVKIQNGEYGIINLNNMIPALQNQATPINICRLMESSEMRDQKYGWLLNAQGVWCNKHSETIVQKANKLYRLITSGRGYESLRNRCCDYRKLEAEMARYVRGINKVDEFVGNNAPKPKSR
jgi:protein AbiQ